jgi:zinc transporter ZupT
MALLFGVATTLATLLGGAFALRRHDKLHLILGFSAGAVVGVAFFDLMPEAFSLTHGHYSYAAVTRTIAVGFLLFMLLSRVVLLHPHGEACESQRHQGTLGAGSLSIHSLLDGVGIGLAFHVSPSVGTIVAIAVLVHDFSDGINTVSFVMGHGGAQKDGRSWLIVDALAPLVGVISTQFIHVAEPTLGLLLALFGGFFLYIGASDLLPESHHRHPTAVTTALTLLGAGVIYLAIRLSG